MTKLPTDARGLIDPDAAAEAYIKGCREYHKDTTLDTLLEEGEGLLRTNAKTLRFRNRIAEVLMKYDIRIPPAPLDALAMAMHRMSKNV